MSHTTQLHTFDRCTLGPTQHLSLLIAHWPPLPPHCSLHCPLLPSHHHTSCVVCSDTAGCDGVSCGTGATCTDATAPNTGYTCSCGTGYTGADVVDGSATCEGMRHWIHTPGLPPHGITHDLLLTAPTACDCSLATAPSSLIGHCCHLTIIRFVLCVQTQLGVMV